MSTVHSPHVGSEELLTGKTGIGAPVKVDVTTTHTQSTWKPSDSARIYGIQQWGQGYFSVNTDGHVAVHPTQKPNVSIDLKKLVDELRERDIALPILVRFTDILRHRVGRLHDAFTSAIRDHDYKGDYRCVYPIKVNQQRHVIEEITEFGKPYGFGLEAGSKPELLAVLG